MAWIRARLRGQLIYARADAQGRPAVEGGRVEIRYRKNDGRLYRAAARNLEVVDATPLPDDTCAVAEEARVGEGKPARKRSTRSRKSSAQPPEPPPEGAVVVYTDGACSSNPGPAGLGVVIDQEDVRIEISEYLGQGTNNIAELSAVLCALEQLDPTQPAVIHTDSQYTIGVAQKGWKAKANSELVARLRAALARHRSARLVYVKGHAGIPLNERADELARLAVERRADRREVRPKG